MNVSLSNIVSASEVQKNYRKVFDQAKSSKKPVIIMVNNKPDVAVMDIKMLKDLEAKIEEFELAQALKAIEEGENELKTGKLKTLDVGSLANLLGD